MRELCLSDELILLDAYTGSDVDALYAGEDDEQARRFGWYPSKSTREQVSAAIARWREAWHVDAPTRAFAIRDGVTRQLVGGCEIRLGDESIARMSYWVFPPWRRRGLATRAVRLGCAYAFSELGVERMELYIEPDNTASRRVAERAGFAQEGRLRSQAILGGERRDMILYARLRSDP